MESSMSDQQATRLIMNLIQLFVGVPGNCLILRVYWTKTLKTSTHVLIMALAWADLAVCLMAVTDIIYMYQGFKRTVGGTTLDFIIHESDEDQTAKQVFFVINEFRNMAIGFSVLITMIIAADRYDCVCRANRRFFSYKRAIIAVWIAFLTASILGISVIIESLLVEKDVDIRPLTWLIRPFFFIAALVMILICYGKIYRTISNHVKMTFVSGPDNGRLRPDEKDTPQMPTVVSDANQFNVPATGKEASSGNKENCTVDRDVISPVQLTSQVEMEERQVTTAENDQRTDVPKQEQVVSRGRPQKLAQTSDLQRKTTRMLFITSVVFLLTWLPFWAYYLIYGATFLQIGENISHVEESLYEINFVVLINNAVNPFIYGIANRRFRKDCREVLRSMKLC